jgi:hypothetical protein
MLLRYRPHTPHDGLPPLQLVLPGQYVLLHQGVDPQRVETLRLLRREKWRIAQLQETGQYRLTTTRLWAQN